MSEEIAALVKALGAPEAEEDVLLVLSRAAMEELEGQLKPGLSPEACGSAFPVACAMLVLSVLEAGEGGVKSFSAGDVTIQRQTGSGSQRQVQAMALMAPYLNESGFAFRGVRG